MYVLPVKLKNGGEGRRCTTPVDELELLIFCDCIV
jgi:hypothetical protein